MKIIKFKRERERGRDNVKLLNPFFASLFPERTVSTTERLKQVFKMPVGLSTPTPAPTLSAA